MIAVGSVTGRDYLKKPGLHRTLFGDGIATTAAGLFGGPPNTTYAEVTGAVMLTKNYNPQIMIWASFFAITLAFIGKFGALLQSIPVPVMGGILCLLFGSIAAVGMNTLIRHKIDSAEARNLVIVSVTGIRDRRRIDRHRQRPERFRPEGHRPVRRDRHRPEPDPAGQ